MACPNAGRSNVKLALALFPPCKNPDTLLNLEPIEFSSPTNSNQNSGVNTTSTLTVLSVIAAATFIMPTYFSKNPTCTGGIRVIFSA